MVENKTLGKILKVAGLAVVGFSVVSLLKSRSPTETVKEVAELPAKVIEDTKEVVEDTTEVVKKTFKKLVKGSPEAKEHMAAMRAKRKPKAEQGFPKVQAVET